MYHVRYVEYCSPKMRSFLSKENAAKFVANFMLKHQFGNIDDNWIEMVFNGDIIYLDPSTPHKERATEGIISKNKRS